MGTRDINPLPALAQLRRLTADIVDKHDLELDHFDIIPSDKDDGVHRVRIIVHEKALDDDVIEARAAFDAIAGDTDAPFASPANDERADKARESLTDLSEKLKKKRGGFLD